MNTMEADHSSKLLKEEQGLVKEDETNLLKPVYFLPFDVQLQNTFCIEIFAKRQPLEIETMPHAQVELEEAQVDIETSRAQIILHVRTVSNQSPSPFDISFKLLGTFTYAETYQEENVRLFLEQGSLSILLPFAREILFNICMRLQVPPMMLTMVQLAPHPSMQPPTEEHNSNK